MKDRNVQNGFTLAEIIVAVAIFMILMSGLAMLFTGSLRAVRQSYMQMDAFERADTALQVIKNDLVTAFSSTEHGDIYTFYGAPTGMTFIGTVQASPEAADEVNIARITYVVYNNWRGWASPSADMVFPEFLAIPDLDGVGNPVLDAAGRPVTMPVPGYGYRLIRYVEPGIGDLESFPVKWEGPIPPDTWDWTGPLPQAVIDQSWLDAGLPAECEADFIKAKKCELWIRMLGGGDGQVPNAWEYPREILGLDVSPLDISPDDYVVTENIMSAIDPGTWRTQFYIDPDFVLKALDPLAAPPISLYARHFQPFFDYDTAYPTAPEDRLRWDNVLAFNPLLSQCQWVSAWWNDYRSLNCDRRLEWRWDIPDIPIAYCEKVRLPQVINATFTMMFEATDASSSDFNRKFSIQVNPPAAYLRDEY